MFNPSKVIARLSVSLGSRRARGNPHRTGLTSFGSWLSHRFQWPFVSVLVGTLVVLAGLFMPSLTVSATTGPDVRISELANGGPGGNNDNFVEIANFGDEPIDIDGWRVYRCTGSGNRATETHLGPVDGVVLEPGDTYMVAHENSTITEEADELVGTNFSNDGYGAWLADGDDALVDRAGVYGPSADVGPTDSDCHAGRDEYVSPDVTTSSLANDLDFGRGQSWQRVGTGDNGAEDWIKAGRTPNAPNATEPDSGVQPSDVLISEITNAGGSTDSFIELANFGEDSADISGWEIYRCSGVGSRHPGLHQATVPDGTVLEPEEVFLAVHENGELADEGQYDVTYDSGLSHLGAGALIEDAEGSVMDAVGLFETDGIHEPPTGSACTQGDALPNQLVYGRGESYQRFQDTGDNSGDFVAAPRTPGELVIHDPDDSDEDPFEYGPVRISEVANAGPGGDLDNYFELANYGDEDVSLDGWSVYQCDSGGRRAVDPQIGPDELEGMTLAPEETLLAVREGGALHEAGEYDVTYATSLSNAGYGLKVRDAQDELVDSFAAYNVVNSPGDRNYSNCHMGLSATNSLDVERGMSYQRLQSTERTRYDFVPASRNPGELAEVRAPADLPEEDLEPVDVAPNPRALPSSLVAPADGDIGLGEDVDVTVTGQHTTDEDVDVSFRGAQRLDVQAHASQAFIGTADEAPPSQRQPGGETVVEEIPLERSDEPIVSEATEGFPYQRYELRVPRLPTHDEIEVVWSGRSVGVNELQLYVWNHLDNEWELLDAGGGVAGGEITLVGTIDIDPRTMRGANVDLLVQDGPQTEGPVFSDQESEPNQAFKDPAEYDFSFGFMTDTQYLTEEFPHTFVDYNRWLVTNEEARDIAYTFHTGDIIENWTQGTHSKAWARSEFELASDAMTILEDAGHPHGVVSGNHDNKWGRSNDLYNEFFPPSRYEDQPWFGEAWRDADKQNHYDVMEIGGAKFLMVLPGFNEGQEAIDWANDVIVDHPDHNVILATHEYLTPEGSVAGPGDRWTVMAHEYWDQIIEPNENVFLVLSGHFNGVALNIKRDVDTVEGRTVVEMLANYSDFDRPNPLQGKHGDRRRDTGFMRLLQFDVDSKTMAVNTYSPYLDEHNAWEYDSQGRYDDIDEEFTVEVDLNDIYDKRVETDLVGLSQPADDLGSKEVAAGSHASVTWKGLERGSAYQWYTESTDADGFAVRSPAWTFTVAQ